MWGTSERNRLGRARFQVDRFSLLCVVGYLAGVLVLLMWILRATHGRLVYALDDPYIHLALADQLAHGHYGINPGETSSPSSSLLWPFLLTPFAGTRMERVTPLLWNIVFAAATAWLIGHSVTEWSRLRPTDSLLGGRNLCWTKRTVVAVLLLFVANLWTLTFVGMEHCLQVLLAALCAYGIAAVLGDRPIPWASLVAAALLPSVRYEGLGLTIAVALAWYGREKQWRKPASLVVVSILPLVGFATFLHFHGLPMLPNSVLVKSRVSQQRYGLVVHTIHTVLDNVAKIPGDLERWPAALISGMLARLCWTEKNRARRWALGGSALAVSMQVLIGQNGWFTRYEVYAVIFGSLLLVRVFAERPPFPFFYFSTGLLLFAAPYILSTQKIVDASLDIYRQQFQMHRFLQDFYAGNVAVNDLGLVSYRRQPNTYVLDLWGLASSEASTRRRKDAAWLDQITIRHQVPLAMIYASWYESIPASWAPLGSLCLTYTPVFLPQRCVVFFSTEPTRRAELQGDVMRFAQALPTGVQFVPGVAAVLLGKDSSTASM